MKKLLLTFSLLLMVLVISGQEYQRIGEISVTAPTFTDESLLTESPSSHSSVLNQYLLGEISESTNDQVFASGKVVVDFTVLPDGTLADFIIKNSVSQDNDQSVIAALETTSGYWNPGKNNGIAVPMDKRVVVAFTSGNNFSFTEVARYHYKKGVQKYICTDRIEEDPWKKEAKIQRITDRKLASALRSFNRATLYAPFDPSICFWQCKIYEKQGNMMMYHQKRSEFEMLTYAINNPNVELIAITIK